MIECASNGSMNSKTPVEVYELIEAVASNNYEKGSEYTKNGIDLQRWMNLTSLKAQIGAMQKQMTKMSVNAVQALMQVYELCTGNHATQDC